MTDSFNPAWAIAGIAALTLISQGVGFIFLTRNHLRHLQASLDILVADVKSMNTRLARLEGRVGADH